MSILANKDTMVLIQGITGAKVCSTGSCSNRHGLSAS